ncbi:hypothetical protein Adt_22926 [Abeliophyllum distichum]|uniref:Uncharacterized protein n=1 Tax=Abeliophyllum distichum TaxID=126358 RepID=A0ABD1S9D3_9LAMI
MARILGVGYVSSPARRANRPDLSGMARKLNRSEICSSYTGAKIYYQICAYVDRENLRYVLTSARVDLDLCWCPAAQILDLYWPRHVRSVLTLVMQISICTGAWSYKSVAQMNRSAVKICSTVEHQHPIFLGSFFVHQSRS